MPPCCWSSPNREDETIFFTNIFSYRSRNALCEHAFQATRADLRARADELEPVLAGYGLGLNIDMLNDLRPQAQRQHRSRN